MDNAAIMVANNGTFLKKKKISTKSNSCFQNKTKDILECNYVMVTTKKISLSLLLLKFINIRELTKKSYIGEYTKKSF